MGRTIEEEIKDGYVYNGYDYRLQVWVAEGVIQDCGHPESMQPGCCTAHRLAGKPVAEQNAAEWFPYGRRTMDHV